MAALSLFLPAVLVEAPEVPTPTAEAAIMRAAAEFCDRSLCWSGWADPVAFSSGVADYDLDDLPSDARLSMIREVWGNGAKLRGADESTIAREVPGWQSAVGSPSHYLLAELSPPSVRFVPTPGQADAGKHFSARLVYAPALGAKKLPDLLAERYLYEIADGAKAYLLAMPDKSWSNQPRSMQLAGAFRSHISSARIKSEHGHVHNRSVVQSREFGM